MKGKKFVWLLGLLLLCFAVTLGAAACKKDTVEEIGPYYAEYGQVFVLPDFAGESIVKDADGVAVTVTDGRFTVTRKDDYSLEVRVGRTTYRGKIIVQCVGVPQLTVSKDLVYGTINSEVVLPTATAVADDETVDVSAKLTQGETEIAVTEGRFTPTAAGEYTYTFTATNADKTTTKAIPVYIEATDGWKKKIASFDKPYGTTQVRNDYGLTVSHSTEKKYGSEAGSTKITFDTSESQHEAVFALGNLHIKDWSNVDGVRLYVYNENTLPVSIMFNWLGKYGAKLLPHTWSQFYMSRTELAELGNANLGGDLDLTSADGMNVAVIAPVTGRGAFNLYFSGLYDGTEDVVTAADVSTMIATFTEANAPDWALKTQIETAYAALSAADQSTVTNYSTFVSKVNTFINAEVTSAGLDTVADVFAYTDHEFGQYQLQFVDCLRGYSSTVKYGSESGSTLMQPYGFYGRILVPYASITDLRGGRVEAIEYYVYNDNAKQYRLVSNETGGEKEYTLPVKTWTKITMDVSAVEYASNIGWFMQIYSGDWNQGIEKECPRFYLSQMRVVRNSIDTAEKLADYITSLGTLDDAKVANIKRYYGMLPSSEQTSAESNYRSTLKSYYLTRDGVDTTAENRLTYFDSEYGTMQIANTNSAGARYSYVTDKKYDSEHGSLLIELGTQWFGDFKFVSTEAELSNYDYVQFYVYYETTNGNTYPAKVYKEYGCEQEIVLTQNGWTKVTLKVTDGFANNAFRFSRVDTTNNGLDQYLYKFYISAVYGVPKLNITTGDALKTYIAGLNEPTEIQCEQVIAYFNALNSDEQAKVDNYRTFVKAYYLERDGVDQTTENRLTYFDSEYGTMQLARTTSDTCSIGYTTDKKYGEEKGSTYVENLGGWNADFKFLNLEEDLSAYDYLEFYVYYENTQTPERPMIMVKEFGVENQIDIAANAWTKVTLKVTDGSFWDTYNSCATDTAFRLTNSANGMQSSARFYFSAVYGVPKTA